MKDLWNGSPIHYFSNAHLNLSNEHVQKVFKSCSKWGDAQVQGCFSWSYLKLFRFYLLYLVFPEVYWLMVLAYHSSFQGLETAQQHFSNIFYKVWHLLYFNFMINRRLILLFYVVESVCHNKNKKYALKEILNIQFSAYSKKVESLRTSILF